MWEAQGVAGFDFKCIICILTTWLPRANRKMDVTGPVSLISIMTLRQLSRILIVNILLLFCLVEIISFLYISVKKPYLRKFEFVPTYLKFSMQDEYEPVAKSVLNPRIIDSTLPWGIWHVPDRKSRHRTNCFMHVSQTLRSMIKGERRSADRPYTNQHGCHCSGYSHGLRRASSPLVPLEPLDHLRRSSCTRYDASSSRAESSLLEY